VGDFLVVHTPLGILAIEFETGKRLWLESSVASAEPSELAGVGADGSDRVFDDATSGNLASDGRLVFAVEVAPESLSSIEAAVGGFGFGRGMGRPPSAWSGGNVLRAYDLANGGSLRWQFPETRRHEQADAIDSSTWFSGPPLVAGNELYVLVEEGGEVRLECRTTEDGHVRWQQPLASYDDRETITSSEARSRRLAGLTPSLVDGVVICPLGAGCVVAIDTATRSLLWSHTYARVTAEDRGQGGASLAAAGEPSAVLSDGFAVLAPYDAPGLFCLRVRDGKPAWPQLKRGRYRVAGVVDRRLIVLTDTAVESLDVATGNRVWRLPLADVGRPSGRGILTPSSYLLPLDTPEVVEIGLADGRIKGRSPSRGGTVPGNLVAHRGEIISRGIEFLEVFHQEAALESRIETARTGVPSSPWAAYWGGQVAIEHGDVKRGLDLVSQAVASHALKLPPGDFSATLVRALERDFATAASWQATSSPEKLDPSVIRKLVDGFLASGDAARAWQALQGLITDDRPQDEAVFRDAADPWLVITADRWNRGRMKRIAAMADATLAGRIDAALRDEVTTAPARLPTHDAPRADAPAELADASAWPLGGVARTMHTASKRQTDHGRMHPIPLDLAGAGLFGTRAMQATLDGSQRRLIITDGLGNAIGTPIPLDGVSQDLMPWVNRTSAMEVAVAGTILFVRTRKELAAYDLDAGPGRGRGLWRRPDQAAGGDPAGEGRWAMGVGGRIARDGWVPLGMRISEPDESPRGDGRGLVAMPGFLLVPGPRSIALLDPTTGRLLWERRRLPPGLEWTVDEDSLCGLTNDGSRSLVLDTTDGRMLHQIDMPHRRQRLATHGRCVVTIRSIDELPGRFTARRVRLELIDPATRQTRSLGEFSGDARATEAGPGRLAVMEPGGGLSLIDLDSASIVFQTTLPDPPRQFARLIVRPWQDRYLVLAGSPVEGEDAAGVSPLQQLMLSSPASAPMSGRLWAVDRMSGESLWQSPAIIERHCLHTAQPPDLPVLAFCRLMHGPGERDQTRLSLLMLDKRTGHAVLDDDRIAIPSHAFLGCEIVGSAEKHTVTIAEPAGGAARLTLTFAGTPIPPQAPYRGSGRLSGARTTDRLQTAGRLFEQALPKDDRADKLDPLLFDPEDFE
jgi:outer membrane protein assembly factor BamB